MFARFQTRMARLAPDGASQRAHLEAAARAGSATAIASLVEPPFPDAIGYLWRWVLDLRRGLGVGMEGLASLTWEALDAWCRRTERSPEPYEVDALFALDSVLREKEDAPDATAQESTVQRTPAWPTKKANANEAVTDG